MIGVCFYFEDNEINVYSGRGADLGLWHDAIRAWLDNKPRMETGMFCINESTGPTPYMVDSDMTIRIYNTIEEMFEEFPNLHYVFLETPGACKDSYVSLLDYTHPNDDVVYVFGADSRGLQKNYPGDWVTIPSFCVLWAVHAMNAVLFHRRIQRGNSR